MPMQIRTYEFNPVAVNTYLLYDETREAAIIDCGASTREEREKLKKGLQGLHLKLLLNTHLHFDHVLGNRFIYDLYGLQPQYHEAEDRLPGLRLQTAAFGLPIDYEPPKAGKFISDGETITFGQTSLKALLTPGHSPGSLSFYAPDDRCLFTGDALFRHDIGRTDLWEGNEKTLIRAIREKLLVLPDDTKIYPGHGPGTSVGEEIRNNPYLQI
jgi:glyoxylase-like metal-dependent hydrolase (beta-lactamase superfamily II)